MGNTTSRDLRRMADEVDAYHLSGNSEKLKEVVTQFWGIVPAEWKKHISNRPNRAYNSISKSKAFNVDIDTQKIIWNWDDNPECYISWSVSSQSGPAPLDFILNLAGEIDQSLLINNIRWRILSIIIAWIDDIFGSGVDALSLLEKAGIVSQPVAARTAPKWIKIASGGRRYDSIAHELGYGSLVYLPAVGRSTYEIYLPLNEKGHSKIIEMLQKQEIPEKAQARWKDPEKTTTYRSANDVLGTVIGHLWGKVWSIVFTSRWEQIRVYEPSLAPDYPSRARDKLSRPPDRKLQAPKKITRDKAPKASAKQRKRAASPPPPPPSKFSSNSTVHDQATRQENATESDEATIPHQPDEPTTGSQSVNAAAGKNPLSTLAEVASSPMMRIESVRAMNGQATPRQIVSHTGTASRQLPAPATTPQAEGIDVECVNDTASPGVIGNPSESIEDTTAAPSATMVGHFIDERDSDLSEESDNKGVEVMVSPPTPVSTAPISTQNAAQSATAMSLHPQSASNVLSNNQTPLTPPPQPPNKNLNEPFHHTTGRSPASYSTSKRPYAEFHDGSNTQPVKQRKKAGSQETFDLEDSDSISSSYPDTSANTESQQGTAEQDASIPMNTRSQETESLTPPSFYFNFDNPEKYAFDWP